MLHELQNGNSLSNLDFLYLRSVEWGHLRTSIAVLPPVTEQVAAIHEVKSVIEEPVGGRGGIKYVGFGPSANNKKVDWQN